MDWFKSEIVLLLLFVSSVYTEDLQPFLKKGKVPKDNLDAFRYISDYASDFNSENLSARRNGEVSYSSYISWKCDKQAWY